MKQLLSTFLLLLPFLTLAQTAEYGDIYVDSKENIESRLHLQEVIPMEGKDQTDIHNLIEAWYDAKYVEKKLVYRYSFNLANGDNEWMQNKDYVPSEGMWKPYNLNEYDRIFTAYIKCEECLTTSKRGRNKSDGYFKLDFQIKNGRVKMVMFAFYDIGAGSYLSYWLVKRNGLVKRPDPRLDAIEVLFAEVKNSLIEFTINPNSIDEEYIPEPIQQNKPNLDDW